MKPIPFVLPAMVLGALATVAAAQTPAPYAGQQQRVIKSLSDDEMRDLQEGRGMGLAKAAELNAYPGPLHVLQLERELGLTDAQRSATEALYNDMKEKAQRIGGKIIDAERELDHAFASAAITQASLRLRLSAIGALQGELRAVHLGTHLAQRALLTPEQIARYDKLRGYAEPTKPHGGMHHPR